jgi:outer membrane protein assembly factor BamB
MSRTVPAVTEKYVVSLGPKCHVTCLDSTTGKYLWGLDLVKDFGTKVPQWYAGQCPLIEDGRAIIAPGGESLMIAVDCSSGEVVWRTPNPHEWDMTHMSICPMEFGGRRCYIYGGLRGLAGVSATDGSILWEYTDLRVNVAWVATPVVVGEDRVFLSAGYNTGSMMLRLKEEGGKIAAERAFALKAKVFGSEQHTPVYYRGHLYGVRPRGELVCLDPDGEVLWTSGEHHFFKGYGPWLVASPDGGGVIYVMDCGTTQAPQGVLKLVEATPKGYKELASTKVPFGPDGGHDAWGPMALAGGRLIVRDLTRMVCLDVRRK